MTIEERREIYAKPIVEQYILLKRFDNGGEVWEHILVDRYKSDYEQIKTIAKLRAKQGMNAKIQPEIDGDYKEYHSKVFPNLKVIGLKNPDLMINDWYEDCKSPKSEGKMIFLATKAKKQNSYLVYFENANFEITNEILNKKINPNNGSSTFWDNYEKEEFSVYKKGKEYKIKKGDKAPFF
jgi:hypothetical protein